MMQIYIFLFFFFQFSVFILGIGFWSLDYNQGVGWLQPKILAIEKIIKIKLPFFNDPNFYFYFFPFLKPDFNC